MCSRVERRPSLVISRNEPLNLADYFLPLRGSLRLDAGEAAASDGLLGYKTKPALHLVKQGGIGWGCSRRRIAPAALARP